MITELNGRKQTLLFQFTNGHEVEVFMYTEARHFSWFVTRNCRKNPSAERISTVSFIKIPNLHLKNEFIDLLKSLKKLVCILGFSGELYTYQRVYSMFILPH